MSENAINVQLDDQQGNTINAYITKDYKTPSKESAKRKSHDQNSSEKLKDNKIPKDWQTPTSTSTVAIMGENNDTGAKPKMIRATGKECASAHYTTRAIIHHTPSPQETRHLPQRSTQHPQ